MTKKEHKQKCWFREKVMVCNFNAEDCNPSECDFYELDFTVKDIKKRAKSEKEEVISLTKRMKDMKKNHEHRTNKEEYDKIKALRNDKAIGMAKLSKAFNYLKRTKMRGDKDSKN